LPPIRLLADRGGELRLPFSAALDESWMGEMALTGG
jgi:hypothetical protein